MGSQLTAHLCLIRKDQETVERECSYANGELLRLQVVNGADVIQTTAGNKVVGGSVGASHDPRRAEGNGVCLVCRESVPYEEFAVLRGRDKVDLIRGPVHGWQGQT